MNTRDKKEPAISLLNAVETLSSIADLEIDHRDFAAFSPDKELQDQEVRRKNWLQSKDEHEKILEIKEIFGVILNYLRSFYRKDGGYISDQKTIEGIKTIMVLVGEAAKKYDRYTMLFNKRRAKSITELKEYKRLQEFYLRRIAHKIDDSVLGKWILALTRKNLTENQALEKNDQTSHVFVDLDSVKKDTDYELFLIRKEDGSRFFSPRLVRNIKLISDFGERIERYREDDPLASVEVWHDRCAHLCAKNIAKEAGGQISQFFKEIKKFRERELVEKLNKAIMALMMGTNPHNLMHNLPIKTCRDYFYDFLIFLREAMQSRDYQRLLSYPSKNDLADCLLDTVHALCVSLYHINGFQELLSMVHGLLQEANQLQSIEHLRALDASKTLWNRLSNDYAAMSKFLKAHPNGSLNKIIQTLENSSYPIFDPLIQDNLPCQLYAIYLQDAKCIVKRMASPTIQEFIHTVDVDDLFKGYLRGCSKDLSRKLLYFNLQDRTSWREMTRCKALEDLAKSDAYPCLSLVTLPKDTEFYYQQAPYHQDNEAQVFLRAFKEQISSKAFGFLFPESIKREIFKEGYIDGLLKTIHRVLFSGKKTLLREQRLNFIEIFYLFLQLKIIELVKPDVLSFVCKDGIDVGGLASAELFAFLKLLNQEMLSENDQEQLDLMLYAPPIMIRERLMLPERFNRMVNAIKAIESLRSEYGPASFAKIIFEAFSHFYETPILHSKVMPAQSRQ